MFSSPTAFVGYTVGTWAGDMAPQGCDQSTDPDAGMRGRRQPPPRHSGRNAVNPGSARAAPSHPSKRGFRFHCSVGRRGLRAPASGAAFEYMAVMEQPVQHRPDSSHVGQESTPVVDGPV